VTARGTLTLFVRVPDYRYELRERGEVVATGHLAREQPFDVGERVEIGGRIGVVRAIEPQLGELELRLLVELIPTDGEL
jgi:hypothetical protein